MSSHRTWCAPHDLDCLARWLPVIEGRALELRPPHETTGPRHDGRPDGIDERDRELRRAIEVLERLEAVAAGPEGARHVVVLAYCYLWMGPEERRTWELKFGGLDARVGLVFAPQRQRMAWPLNPAHTIGTAAAARAGAELREAAVAAYETHALESGPFPRLPFATLREQIAGALDATAAAIAKLQRVRQQNRVHGRR